MEEQLTITNKKKRNSSIELLRLIFMMFILIHHIYIHGVNKDIDYIFNLAKAPETSIHVALFFLTKISVTGFIFMSGYYGIKMNLNKWINLLLTLVFYASSLIFFSGRKWMLDFVFHPFDLWWFMNAYVVICLLSSFIEYSIKTMPQRTFRNTAICFFLLNYFAHIYMDDHSPLFLISVYIIARYIRLYQPKIIIMHYKLIGLLSSILFICYPIISIPLGIPLIVIRIWFSSNNPLILCICCSVILYANKRHTYSNFINYLASSAIAIYLITDFEYIRTNYISHLFNQLLDGYGFLYAIIISILCIVIDKIRVLIFNHCIPWIK